MLLQREKELLQSTFDMFINSGVRKYFYQAMLKYYQRHIDEVTYRDRLYEGLCSTFKGVFKNFECRTHNNNYVVDLLSMELITESCFPEFAQEHDILKCNYKANSNGDFPYFCNYWWDIADYESRIEFMERVIARCDINT